MKINSKAIADNIKRYRYKANVTQRQLADAAGINLKYISHLENNKSVPGLDILSRIADALSVTLDALLYENLKYFHQNSSESKDERALNQEFATKTIEELEYYSKILDCFLKSGYYK